jgi:hypothetical protein
VLLVLSQLRKTVNSPNPWRLADSLNAVKKISRKLDPEKGEYI